MGMENASSSSTVQWKYDVFISFRGEDTRNNFMDHLYNALIVKGINTFRDDEKLDRGKPISLELLKAIEESRFTIVILSKDYASSHWCLDELAKIIACKEDMGMIVLPVFHYVEPSDVRKQMGTFAQAFIKHEEEEETRVDKWRDALRQVGNLPGWHLKNTRPESQVIQEIVGWISLNLKYDAFPYLTKDLVGIHSRLLELESCLALNSKDVLFIGIWGMGGMGKTTLARVVYHMFSKEFEARGFIEDVRKNFEQNGCVSLQQKIINEVLMENNLKIEEEYDGVLKIKNRLCRKRVILALDDVHEVKQLRMLAGERNWFGPGSRIIITTRDAHVLKAHRVNEIYEVKGLNDEDALQLLCLRALEQEHDLDDYIELSNHFLSYASGLPLALEVLGSFLCGKSIDEWKNALERLQEFSNEEILRVLEISFNGLQKSQKEIFLHIACFFNNQKKDYVLEILDILGLYPIIGLKELTDKSLLKIMDNDVVWMHDLLGEMGRNMVRQECLDDPGKRSRLWDYEDINKVLKINKGTEALKAMDIASTCNEQQDGCWNPEAFLKMDNLKFLRIYGTLYVPTHLPNDLRILDWISYPSKSLPSSFQLDELVQLCLQQSQIQQLWIGIKNFDKLKFIDLTDSMDLFITPDFTGVPNLEKLVLVRCTNLRKFDPSIRILKKLIYLNLQDCERLIRLPSKFGMESLVTLEISNCPKLKTIPKFVANPKFLQELSLDRTAIVDLIKNLPEKLWIIKGLEILDLSKVDIEELPSSIERLTGLTSLTLRYCENLVSLPNTICNLKLLKSLDLFGCLKFRNLPKNIGNVKGLELLNLCWTAISDVPSSIALLKNLKRLYICRWNSSESYSLPTSLELLGFVFPSLISTSHVNPIISVHQMSSKHGSPQPLQLLLPSLSGLQSLTYLHLSDCSLLSIPDDIGCLSSLEHLNLSGNDFVSLPKSMSQLSNLRRLHLEGCKEIWSLANVPSTIDSVIANNCTSLMRLPELQFYTFRSDHSHLNFQYVNCFSLARYIGSSGSMLQGQSGNLPDIFDIVIPECCFLEGFFPKRFEHESVSHELKVQVPYGRDELMGIELCVCFSVAKASKDFLLTCWIKVNGFQSASPIRFSFRANYGSVSSRHFWQLYLSSRYFDSQWGENFFQIDGNGSNEIEIRISTSNNLEVEKFGIHYDIINDSASKSTQNKRSHNEDDRAGPFGEGYSIDEPPQIFDFFASSMKRKRALLPPPSSSSSTCQQKYNVFLSFRGEDICNTFTDLLYETLQQKVIITFRDKERLERGESIASELFEAIEESQFAIIILSKNYASSTWCLDELAKIIKCRKEMGLTVFPIFYNVDQSDVRKQTGPFEQAFIDHQKCFEGNIKRVETWRATLREVADIFDRHLQNRHESEIIQYIVKRITKKLSSKSSIINKNLIGINSMVEKLIPSYVGFGNNIYMMGICGMGGLGKTTLAKAIYYEYSDHFEGSSFIANVRERSEKGKLHKLQQQLLDEILERSNTKIHNVQVGVEKIKRSGLCHKKVLLVLDDVSHKDQLENLAGERDWFGSGSWIIITTRDENVLVNHRVLNIYKPNGLDDDDASKFFCSKAFTKEQLEEGYMQVKQKVVKYASGLPLALVTLGSFLCGRLVEEWQSALDSFVNIEGSIYDILKISYDGLDEMWKEIFLDIACFFRGQKKDKVIQILENCGFDARIGVRVLVERSLLMVDDKECFGMHDLLLEMGQKIIRFESGGKLGKQSRLWLTEDLLHVLENDMATEAIQAIVVQYKENDFNFEEVLEVLLSKMSNLRLMIIHKTYNVYDRGHLAVPNDQRQFFVPNQLRHLSWNYYPLKFLSSNSQPKKLVQLDLKYSRLKYLWQGVMHSVNLKFISLCWSENLIKTPDFSGVPMLEGLDFSECDSLVEIHPSIGKLSKLRYLHLEGCKSLTDLPCMSAEMQSLTNLELGHCSKISLFPNFTGIMKSLSKLNLSWTAIKAVPPSLIKCLTTLTLLDLNFCKNLECLPSNMDNLRSLQTLNLTSCKKLKSLPRLPSTVRCIRVESCDFLKWLPARVKLSIWSQPLYQWLPYSERHSREKFTILFHFLQVQGFFCRKTVYGTSSKGKDDGSINEFQIIMPSYLIEIVENSISIELPSNWYNSKWIGLTLWVSKLAGRSIYSIRARVVAIGKMPQNHNAFELTTWINVEVKTEFYFNNYLLYLSRNVWFATVGNGECSQIKVIFEGGNLYEMEFGVSLVYEKDVDEFNQTNVQCLIASIGEVPIYKLTVGDDDGDDNEGDDDGDDNEDDDEDDDYNERYKFYECL